jgi:hypothetical protein
MVSLESKVEQFLSAAGKSRNPLKGQDAERAKGEYESVVWSCELAVIKLFPPSLIPVLTT